MTELVFALEFRGKAGPVPGTEGKRQARSTATMESGETAVFDGRVQRFGDGTFVEEGTITYGSTGSITFETLGRGWVGPAPIDGWMTGGVVWTITGGDGRFAGATGIVTSNFTVNASGDVIDGHFARIYVA